MVFPGKVHQIQVSVNFFWLKYRSAVESLGWVCGLLELQMGSFKVAFDTRKPHLNQIKAKIVDMRRVLEQISVKWLKYVLLEAFLGPFWGPKTMFLK